VDRRIEIGTRLVQDGYDPGRIPPVARQVRE
jgi:hypothetical protein